MNSSGNIFKRFHHWLGNHNLAGFLIGLFLLTPAFTLSYMGNVLKYDIHGMLIFLSLAFFLYGIYVLTRSFISALKKGNRVAEFIFGIILLLIGCVVMYYTLPELEGWAEGLEGSAVKFGKIIIPGVILVVLVPGIGVVFIGYGIYRIVRAFLPETKRRKRKYYRKRIR